MTDDTTDAQGGLIGRLLPPYKRTRRPRDEDRRTLDGICMCSVVAADGETYPDGTVAR